MFGPRITTVFRSRWNALFWAGGILLTAYCSVPSPDEPDRSADAEAVAAIMAEHGAGRHEAEHHSNPWAKDPD